MTQAKVKFVSFAEYLRADWQDADWRDTGLADEGFYEFIDVPPLVLIVEVVSPGKANAERDYIHKRDQYADLGVSEYWLITRCDRWCGC